MKIKVLTKREHQIMDILWNSNSALSAQKIKDDCPDMSIYSVQQVLQRLLKYEYIQVADIGHTKNAIARLYVAKLTQPNYMQFLMGKNSKNLIELISLLIDNVNDADEIKDIINKAKEKQEQLEK